MAYHVNIINQKSDGTYFFEGRARVLRTIKDDVKEVDFGDDCGTVWRFVDPAAQNIEADDMDLYIAEQNKARGQRVIR